MADEKTIELRKWNAKAVVVLIITVFFMGTCAWGLYAGKLQWDVWFNGMAPVLAMGLGWLLREVTTTQ